MEKLEELARWIEQKIPSGDWHEKIYSYCERGGDQAFWAEPVNALSNGAFIVAALAAFFLWVRAGQWRIIDLALILLVFVIGTGSFLFHTVAARWASVADVLPITIFMLAYLGYVLRRFMGVQWVFVIIGVALFYVVLWQADALRCESGRCLNGSLGYLPALGVLLASGLSLLIVRHGAGPSLIFAGVIFGVSLVFRTFDQEWCGLLVSTDGGPLGTHFLWHFLNALLLFVLLRAAVRHGGGTRRLREVAERG